MPGVEAPCTARALLLGGDASLSSLLTDVLGELGIALDLDGWIVDALDGSETIDRDVVAASARLS